MKKLRRSKNSAVLETLHTRSTELLMENLFKFIVKSEFAVGV